MEAEKTLAELIAEFRALKGKPHVVVARLDEVMHEVARLDAAQLEALLGELGIPGRILHHHGGNTSGLGLLEAAIRVRRRLAELREADLGH